MAKHHKPKLIPTREQVMDRLKNVIDPELNISIVDLGLVYGVKIYASGKVRVNMTLTSVGCPLFSVIADQVKDKVSRLPGVSETEINLTFDPPWTPKRMSRLARLHLGL